MAKNGKIFKLPVGKHAAAPEKQPEGEIHDEPDAAEHPALQAVPPPRISKKALLLNGAILIKQRMEYLQMLEKRAADCLLYTSRCV